MLSAASLRHFINDMTRSLFLASCPPLKGGFGSAFGSGGLGVALLGMLVDQMGIDFVCRVRAFLPAIGFLAVLLPGLDRDQRRRAA